MTESLKYSESLQIGELIFKMPSVVRVCRKAGCLCGPLKDVLHRLRPLCGGGRQQSLGATCRYINHTVVRGLQQLPGQRALLQQLTPAASEAHGCTQALLLQNNVHEPQLCNRRWQVRVSLERRRNRRLINNSSISPKVCSIGYPINAQEKQEHLGKLCLQSIRTKKSQQDQLAVSEVNP